MTTSPITKQRKGAKPAAVAAEAALRTWCCGTPITGPHIDGCAYEPREDNPVDYTGPVDAVEPEAPEPPPTPTQVTAAAPRVYGFGSDSDEQDLELPSGYWVRYRKLGVADVLEQGLFEAVDAFTPQLVSDLNSGDEDTVNAAALGALADPARNAKLFGPINRVVAAAVVDPKVVLDGPTNNTQTNISKIDLVDRMAIFMAAVGEQLEALKSLREEQARSA